jgi:hypothetical protein
MPLAPLTKKQLLGYFQVYRDAFPDWKVEHGVMLTRSLGPISQHIPFQNLQYGAYRPSCSIRVIGPPDGGSALLIQLLDVKHREVEPRQHDTKWPLVLKAMEEQFVPNIRKPLDMEEVVRLAEEEVGHDGVESIRECTGLATLNVHLRRFKKAIEWCDRAEASLGRIGREPVAWELAQAQFASQLRGAIQNDRGLEFLANSAKY